MANEPKLTPQAKDFEEWLGIARLSDDSCDRWGILGMCGENCPAFKPGCSLGIELAATNTQKESAENGK